MQIITFSRFGDNNPGSIILTVENNVELQAPWVAAEEMRPLGSAAGGSRTLVLFHPAQGLNQLLAN